MIFRCILIILILFPSALWAQQLPETDVYSCLNFQSLFQRITDPRNLMVLYEAAPRRNSEKKKNSAELIQKKFISPKSKSRSHFGALLQSNDIHLLKVDINISTSLTDDPFYFNKSRFYKKNSRDYVYVKLNSSLFSSISNKALEFSSQDIDELLINYDIYNEIVELKYTGFVQTVYTLNLESLKSEIEIRELLQNGEQLFFVHSSEDGVDSNRVGVRWIF